MRILLIGGAGFVSGAILRVAAERGHEVTAVTRGRRPLVPGLARAHLTLDREEAGFVGRIDRDGFDAVIDCVCMRADHAGQAVELARGGKRLIMISSDYVYDPRHRKLFLTEAEARFTNRDDMGGFKRQAEEIVLAADAAGSVRATILRPPHVYGPGSNPGTIPRHGRSISLLDDIDAGKTLHLLQGGLGLIQPVHVDDLARVTVAMLDRPDAVGQAYNAPGPELMTHLDYYRTIADGLGRSLSVTAYWPEGGEAPDVNHYVGGHRCYDGGRLNALLPDFRYTSFTEGVAAWIRAIRA